MHHLHQFLRAKNITTKQMMIGMLHFTNVIPILLHLFYYLRSFLNKGAYFQFENALLKLFHFKNIRENFSHFFFHRNSNEIASLSSVFSGIRVRSPERG